MLLVNLSATVGTQAFKVQTAGPRATRVSRPFTVCASSAEAAESATTSEPKIENAGPEKVKAYVGKGKYLTKDEAADLFTAIEKTGRDNSLTGGFAGGEVYLKSLAESFPKKKPSESKQAAAAPAAKGKGLYIGKGRFVDDDKSDTAKVIKGTGRDGALTGGFTGGELGLKTYMETGTLDFTDGVVRRQQSPLIVAGIISALGVTGGLLFNDVEVLGEKAISGQPIVDTSALPQVDGTTTTYIQIAVILVGVLGTGLAGKIVLDSFAKSLQEGASRLATFAVFWMAVFFAAKAILFSP